MLAVLIPTHSFIMLVLVLALVLGSTSCSSLGCSWLLTCRLVLPCLAVKLLAVTTDNKPTSWLVYLAKEDVISSVVARSWHQREILKHWVMQNSGSVSCGFKAFFNWAPSVSFSCLWWLASTSCLGHWQSQWLLSPTELLITGVDNLWPNTFISGMQHNETERTNAQPMLLIHLSPTWVDQWWWYWWWWRWWKKWWWWYRLIPRKYTQWLIKTVGTLALAQ